MQADFGGLPVGEAAAHPVCSSSPGFVRCHVGCVTLRPIASSSPCAHFVTQMLMGRSPAEARQPSGKTMWKEQSQARLQAGLHQTTAHLEVADRETPVGPWTGEGDVERIASR